VGFYLSALIVWLHRSNIQRLLKGQERKTNLLGGGEKK
jgi:glycerol-3-phosphate acyltransferase PlsY